MEKLTYKCVVNKHTLFVAVIGKYGAVHASITSVKPIDEYKDGLDIWIHSRTHKPGYSKMDRCDWLDGNNCWVDSTTIYKGLDAHIIDVLTAQYFLHLGEGQ